MLQMDIVSPRAPPSILFNNTLGNAKTKTDKSFASTSLPAFSEHGFSDSKLEKVSSNRNRYLNYKRRDEILQRFIEESEDKYREFSSTRVSRQTFKPGEEQSKNKEMYMYTHGQLNNLDTSPKTSGVAAKADITESEPVLLRNKPRSVSAKLHRNVEVTTPPSQHKVVAFKMPPTAIHRDNEAPLDETGTNEAPVTLIHKSIDKQSLKTAKHKSKLFMKGVSGDTSFKSANDRLKSMLGDLGKHKKSGQTLTYKTGDDVRARSPRSVTGNNVTLHNGKQHPEQRQIPQPINSKYTHNDISSVNSGINHQPAVISHDLTVINTKTNNNGKNSNRPAPYVNHNDKYNGGLQALSNNSVCTSPEQCHSEFVSKTNKAISNYQVNTGRKLLSGLVKEKEVNGNRTTTFTTSSQELGNKPTTRVVTVINAGDKHEKQCLKTTDVNITRGDSAADINRLGRSNDLLKHNQIDRRNDDKRPYDGDKSRNYTDKPLRVMKADNKQTKSLDNKTVHHRDNLQSVIESDASENIFTRDKEIGLGTSIDNNSIKSEKKIDYRKHKAGDNVTSQSININSELSTNKVSRNRYNWKDSSERRINTGVIGGDKTFNKVAKTLTNSGAGNKHDNDSNSVISTNQPINTSGDTDAYNDIHKAGSNYNNTALHDNAAGIEWRGGENCFGSIDHRNTKGITNSNDEWSELDSAKAAFVQKSENTQVHSVVLDSGNRKNVNFNTKTLHKDINYDGDDKKIFSKSTISKDNSLTPKKLNILKIPLTDKNDKQSDNSEKVVYRANESNKNNLNTAPYLQLNDANTPRNTTHKKPSTYGQILNKFDSPDSTVDNRATKVSADNTTQNAALIAKSRKLIERLKVKTLPNRADVPSFPSRKFKSHSHENFQEKKPEPLNVTKDDTAKPKQADVTPTVSQSGKHSGAHAPNGVISSRSVYLSSQSCDNFAQFDKNDFKSALQRLKNNSNKSVTPANSPVKGLTPSPVGVKATPTPGLTPSPVSSFGSRSRYKARYKSPQSKGAYPSNIETLYNITETPDSELAESVESEEDNCPPSCRSSVISFESLDTNYGLCDTGYEQRDTGDEPNQGTTPRHNHGKYDRNSSERLTHPSNSPFTHSNEDIASSLQSPLPDVTHGNHHPINMVPSYGAPLKATHGRSTALARNANTPNTPNTHLYSNTPNTHLYSMSHDQLHGGANHRRQQIDVGAVGGLGASQSVRRRRAERGESPLISRSTTTINLSMPRGGGGGDLRSRPPSRGANNAAVYSKAGEVYSQHGYRGDVEGDGFVSEGTSSTASSYRSGNVPDAFASAASAAVNGADTKSLRPKSSKGRQRPVVQQRISMNSEPSSKVTLERKTSTTVFNINPHGNDGGSVKSDVNPFNEQSNFHRFVHERPPIGFTAPKMRPKSSKGRTRHIPQNQENHGQDTYMPNSNVLLNSPSMSGFKIAPSAGTAEAAKTLDRNARPKSSKGRSRPVVLQSVRNNSPVDRDDIIVPATEQSVAVQQLKSRPKSAKGRVRHDKPTANKNNLPNTTTNTDTDVTNGRNNILVKHNRESLSINTVPVDNSQHKRRNSKNMDKTIQPPKRKDKYFKPQSGLDPDSGNDTDVDGEIEILDLDKLDADAESDDFPVSLPRSLQIAAEVLNSATYTTSSQSSTPSVGAWNSITTSPPHAANGNDSHRYSNGDKHYPSGDKHYPSGRQGNNNGEYDSCTAVTPRLTPQQVAERKSHNYDTINSEMYDSRLGAERSRKREKQQQQSLKTMKTMAGYIDDKDSGSYDMQTSNNSSIRDFGAQRDSMTDFNTGSRYRIENDGSFEYSKHRHHGDLNSGTKNIPIQNEQMQSPFGSNNPFSQPLSMQFANQSHVHPIHDRPSRKEKSGPRKTQQPQKLKPLQSLGSLETFNMNANTLSFETPLYSQSTHTFQRFGEGNVNNCNSSHVVNGDGANRDSLVSVPTQNKKAKKLAKQPRGDSKGVVFKAHTHENSLVIHH